MENAKNEGEVGKCVSLRLPSFREAISRAENQVGFAELQRSTKRIGDVLDLQFIHECLSIIAEIYMMSDEREIRISGEWLEVRLVKQILEAITREHIIMVLERYKELEEPIRNKKAYLRAMLYNSVFSLEAELKKI